MHSVGGEGAAVRSFERLEQPSFLLAVDERSSDLLFVRAEFPDKPDACVHGVEDRAILRRNRGTQIVGANVVYGRPSKCNNSVFLVRGVVINTNGYVTRAVTGSPSVGVLSFTVNARRLPRAYSETTWSV